MNLKITGHHLVVTPAMHSYFIEKMEKIKRHFDHVIDASVILSVEKLIQKAEITLHVRGKDIHVEATNENLYAAIDALIDKLDRQVLRHKDKSKSHDRESMKYKSAQIDSINHDSSE